MIDKKTTKTVTWSAPNGQVISEAEADRLQRSSSPTTPSLTEST